MKDPFNDTMLIFTDGSSNVRAAYVVAGKRYVVQTDLASAQIVELRSVAVAFQLFANNAFNFYTESHYTFTAIQVIETVAWIGIGSSQVNIPFQQIQDAIHLRKMTCCVGHTTAHSNLPGPLAEGNALADKFTQLITLSQLELA